ncbi:MAG TPA: NAD-dependent epimerase/dehydratase family protein [Gemmatimonadales bacterium]|nr:NAD-dependent epimerase/dehydratase family protein [Gemmatimonadales bacterium]
MSPRILVTGAAGFIGSHVAEALVGRGDAVIGLDNFDPFYPRALKERNLETLRAARGFRFVEADIVRHAVPLDDVAVVVHLAARPGVAPSLENPAGYVEVNVTGTTRVLDAARRAGVGRVVFGSSSSVYGDATPAPFAETAPAVTPISPYAATKRAGELLAACFAHLYGSRIACLRFFTVYGPRQRPDLAIHRFTDRIARGLPVGQRGDGSSERDYTYISDAVQGVLAAVDWTGAEGGGARGAGTGACEAFNIGGGARVRLDRLLGLIAQALGKTPVVEHLADQPGDVRRTAADLGRAQATLGYRPTVGIEEGIRQFVRWYEATHGRQS